jgi:hypothetical protein
VIEAAVDDRGVWLPSVPVIAVEPTTPGDEALLWRIAAVLLSPVASVLVATAGAGTGLSGHAVRVRAAALLELPLPVEGASWADGAAHARTATQAARAADAAGWRSALVALGTAMDDAYRLRDGRASAWWAPQLPARPGGGDGPSA